MFSFSHENVVNQLQNQYQGGVIFGGRQCVLHSKGDINNNGFIGSSNVVSLSCNGVITVEAPGCVAAPLVTMIAKNAISMGIDGQKDKSVPTRLYVPGQLSITTRQLSIGDLTILVEPKYGFISCKKLVLSKPTEEDLPHFEIVKSWVMDDDTEIEIVQR